MKEKNHIVKARFHHGSNSLDLTIPASYVKEFGINVGDVFKVKADINGNKLIIEYQKIYSNI